MSMMSDNLHFIQFADDTSVFMSDKDPQNLYNRFNNELINLTEWLSVNKLILNVRKTNYMLFSNRRSDTNTVIKLGDEVIKCVSSLKF